MRRRSTATTVWRLLPVVAAALIFASQARAGGGPENLFLVVNARSWSSLTVANHYVRLRKIPAPNVFHLDWTEDNERIDLETFRTKLLGPVLKEIERRGLGDHIDYVVYSTDFPWAVECAKETEGRGLSKYLTPTASLNGATYLFQNVLARRLEFMFFDANRYFRAPPSTGPPASHGFRSWYGWGKQGRLLEAGGERYLLSTMLGVTSGRGTSTADVVRYLTRSVEADFTRPPGTIYFARNEDVRSTTRADLFAPAAAALNELGIRAETVEGVLPQGRGDVMGATVGSADFNWRAARSTVGPGAICEHLTSTGGVLSEGAGQTPLTEHLLAGAAVSSGAVTEPYAIAQKFPTAYLHLHYARGCSAAESFYQSVHGPYQLLIVGDPLCRPWADPPRVTLSGVAGGDTVRDLLKIAPTVADAVRTPVKRCELYVDGILYDECDATAGATLGLDTRRLIDGHHELRVMAVGGEPIETRGGLLLPVTVANRGLPPVTLTHVADGAVRWDEPLRFSVASPGAKGLVLVQGSRNIVQALGESAEFAVDPRFFGLGPITLQAVAVGAEPGTNRISPPVEIEIHPNLPLESFALRGGEKFKPGMLLTQETGEPRVLFSLTPETWLQDQGVESGEKFSLTGFFNTDADGEFQFQVRHAMELEVLVDDRPIFSGKNDAWTLDYAAVALRAGLHKLELRGRRFDDARLTGRYGRAGLRGLRPSALTHNPPPE